MGIIQFGIVCLLLVNSVAILNEERFLARIGWSTVQQPYQQQYSGDGFDESDGPSVKARLINLIGAVRTLLRVPLIVLNTMVVLYKLVL